MIPLLLLALFLSPSRTPARSVAVTFDDLPGVAVVGDGVEARRRLNERLLHAVKRHGVPAIGFVNESKLASTSGRADPATVALLDLWLDAGLELGNHTYSHRDLNLAPLEEWESEVIRGEEVTRELLRRRERRLRFFRHPMLHTGRDLETKRATEKFLAEHGYRVAPVTIDSSEWIFAKAYEIASERGDRTLAARIADAYVPYMERKFDYFERQSRALFGREIAQVLLLHANSLNADRFDELARMMENRGYRFGTLEDALRDPAYRTPDTYTGGEGITWLHRWALSTGRRRAIVPNEPLTPKFVLEASGIPSE